MKRLYYAIMFAGTASLSGGVAYMVAPSQIIQASVSSNPNTNKPDNSQEEGNDDDWSWAPVELTPAQDFIQNLTDMRGLSLSSGTVNISSDSFELAVENLAMSLSINDITTGDIALSAGADLLYKGHRLPIEAAYVEGTIYLSALGIDMKAVSDDFSTFMGMLGSFGVDSGSLSEGSVLDDLDMNSVIADLGAMTYEEEEGGYRYTVNLLGIPLTFHSDINKMVTGIEIEEGSIAGITISAQTDASMTMFDPTEIKAPETDERPFQSFSDYLNLIDGVSVLTKETRFGLTVEGSLSDLSTFNKVEIDAKLQFDITEQSGKGILNVGQDYTSYIPTSDSLQLEIEKEDVKFLLNDTLYGKFNFDTCRDLFSTISDLVFPEGEDLSSQLGDALPSFEGTILEHVLNGEYEYLIDSGWLKNLYVDSSKADLVLSSELLGTDNDIHVLLTLDNGSLKSLELLDFSGFGYAGSFKVTLEDYGFVEETLPSEEIQKYMDLTYANNLVENVLPLLDQKKFALELNGGFHKPNVDGVTFEGNAQFDLETKEGHGNITITELDKDYDDIPVHDLSIDVDNEDMKFRYNEGLYGKFTLQTIRDLGSMVGELLEDENSRIYEYIGDSLDKVENVLLDQITGGDYYSVATGALKDLDTMENGARIVISKELLQLDSDITVEIGYGETGIETITLPEFSAMGQLIQLNATLVEYNEDYQWLPEDKKYYDFSDIKVLLQFGIDTIDLSYYHLSGTVDIDSMKLGSMSLSGLAGLFVKGSITLDFEIFDDNGDIKVNGTIGNIPTINGVNYHGVSICAIHDHSKTVTFNYSDKTVYLSRTEYYKGGTLNLSCKKETRYTKVSADVFMDEIAYYMVDFVLSINEDIQDDIFAEKTDDTKDNTAPDYSKLFNDYSYTHEEGSNAYRWYFDVNLGEITKTDIIEYLRITCDAEEKECSDNKTRGFLTHLIASVKINASGFSIGFTLNADMKNFDVSITPDRFTEVSGYNHTLSYIASHQGDSPMDYSRFKA